MRLNIQSNSPLKPGQLNGANLGVYNSIVGLLLSCLLLLATTTSQAQTHPFVGSYTVIIQLKESRLPANSHLELRELSVVSDSCRFETSPIQIRFQTPADVLIQNRYQNATWTRQAKEYAKKADFMKKGYLAVVLNQSERYCMIPRNNDYLFTPRSFCIVMVTGDTATTLAKVPAAEVFSLSTFRGRWNEIKAIPLQLSQH